MFDRFHASSVLVSCTLGYQNAQQQRFSFQMSRQPTNTIIVTKVDPQLLLEPQPVIQCLANNNFVVELIALPKFQRILIICENTRVSSKVASILSDHFPFSITYSIKDVALAVTAGPEYANNDKDFLELPLESGSRRFLISPPLSPPAEWDHWDKIEEGPNQQTVYAPHELSHLLWERLGNRDSNTVRKFHGEAAPINLDLEPMLLFENIDNGVPAIILDSAEKGEEPQTQGRTIAKTSMPPTDP